MSDNIFNQDWFRLFNHTSMAEYLKMSQRFKKFGLTSKDVEEAIQSACDFFHIPMPRMIQDMTNVHNGQTMFVNFNPSSYENGTTRLLAPSIRFFVKLIFSSA